MKDDAKTREAILRNSSVVENAPYLLENPVAIRVACSSNSNSGSGSSAVPGKQK